LEATRNIGQLTDHLFRRESGKMVAVLTKIFGTQNLETAEDVVQQTFIDAIHVWKLKGVPDNPSAWLFRVAKNKAIDVIRRNKHAISFDFSDGERVLLNSGYTMATTMDYFWKEDLVKDDLLRMMFACCHPGISQENQVTLILKTLCGFSTAEIAKSFITSEDTVSKRIYRAKEFFREHNVKMEIPSVHELKSRTNAVLHSVYLLFNEGYNSTHSENIIRQELIDEAMVLGKMLAENKHTQLPEVFAMMALMCFHSARSESRLTTDGEIILLPEQDRSKWNYNLVEEGNRYMDLAAFGDEISTYHLEAAIAYEHCTAPDFESTNWERILFLYDWLCRISPSAIAALNRVVAVMQVKGPAQALESLTSIADSDKLNSFYLYHALLGTIYARLNKTPEALDEFKRAIALTQSEKEKKILHHKIKELLN
jgi:RNA polymerase sigma factor (sigma-70 family)